MLDRRSFLKGGVLAATTGALAATVGCAPSGKKESASSAAADAIDLPKGTLASDFEESAVEPDFNGDVSAEETYDIVVVGAGCSGLPAILTALEEGATVGVLQKEADAAANGAGCSAVILGHTNEKGLKHWVSDWQKENRWRLNTDLFDFYIQHSEETLSWIVQQAMSVDFAPARFSTKNTILYEDGGVIATCEATSKSNDELMKKLIVKAQDLGAVVHFETPAVQIETDSNGKVTGVIGKGKDGYIRMNATKAVIMAAGDYQNNSSLVDRYCADVKDLWRKQTNRTGDGHLLASLAGGHICSSNHAKQCHDLTSSGNTFMATPFLALDPKGERFFNEECPMTSWNVVMKYHFTNEQPIIYRFFDSQYETKYKGVGQVPPMETLEKNLTVNDTTGQRHMWKADTIEELCKELDLDAAAFKASIDRYNELCAKGEDDDFGKNAAYMQPIDTPPFFVLQNKPSCSAINGGVEVDEHYQVVDQDRKPIEGLFAVGVNGGDLCGGIDWTMPGGVSNCHCFNAGRYATIYALTGDLKPSNPCTFEQVQDNFRDKNGQFNWENPAVAAKAIEIW